MIDHNKLLMKISKSVSGIDCSFKCKIFRALFNMSAIHSKVAF